MGRDMMQVPVVISFLEQMLKSDEDFLKNRVGTICCGCGVNTYVGRYPFWHRYARKLCGDCGEKYSAFLKQLGAWDN
jgi:hypothetical protein